MKEIEVKILDINVQEVRRKLLDLGAEKVFDGEVHFIVFDFPNETLRKEFKHLRVRKVGNQTELCLKEKGENSKFKTQIETEVTTSNFEDTLSIFQKIGLKIFHDRRKHRESYKFKNIKFEIDNWEGVPPFLEIEATTEEDVQEYVEKLGFTMEQASDMNGFQVNKHYKNG